MLLMLWFPRERGIPIVREAWLSDSIEKKEAQPLDAYDIASDLAVGGKGIPLYQQDPTEEALETFNSEVFQELSVLSDYDYGTCF